MTDIKIHPTRTGQFCLKVDLEGPPEEVNKILEELKSEAAVSLRVQTGTRNRWDSWYTVGNVHASEDTKFRLSLSRISHKLSDDCRRKLWDVVNYVRRLQK